MSFKKILGSLLLSSITIGAITTSTFAQETVKLDRTQYYPGDKVTITGTSDASKVQIKVVASSKAVLLLDTKQVNSTDKSFSYSFILPKDLQNALYTIYVGNKTSNANVPLNINMGVRPEISSFALGDFQGQIDQSDGKITVSVPQGIDTSKLQAVVNNGDTSIKITMPETNEYNFEFSNGSTAEYSLVVNTLETSAISNIGDSILIGDKAYSIRSLFNKQMNPSIADQLDKVGYTDAINNNKPLTDLNIYFKINNSPITQLWDNTKVFNSNGQYIQYFDASGVLSKFYK